MPLASVGISACKRVDADLADDVVAGRPVAVEALDIRQDQQLLGAECHGQGGRRRVCVDVVDLAAVVGRDGRHHRDAAGVDEVLHGFGSDGSDLADQAEVDVLAVDHRARALRREEPGVLTGQPDRERAVLVEEADELAADLPDEHHPYDVHRLRRRHPQAGPELRRDAEPVEHRADLGSAAVDDDRPEAGVPEPDDVLGEGLLEGVVGHGVAAVLHHDRLAVVLLQPRQRLGEGCRLGGRLLPVDAHDEYAEFSWT